MIQFASAISMAAVFIATVYFWLSVHSISLSCSKATARKLRYSLAVMILGGLSLGFVTGLFANDWARVWIGIIWTLITAVCLYVLADGLKTAVHEASQSASVGTSGNDS